MQKNHPEPNFTFIAPLFPVCYNQNQERALRRGVRRNCKTEEKTMEASTVYYTDFRCPVGTSLTEKLRRLCLAAGIKNIDMDG